MGPAGAVWSVGPADPLCRGVGDTRRSRAGPMLLPHTKAKWVRAGPMLLPHTKAKRARWSSPWLRGQQGFVLSGRPGRLFVCFVRPQGYRQGGLVRVASGRPRQGGLVRAVWASFCVPRAASGRPQGGLRAASGRPCQGGLVRTALTWRPCQGGSLCGPCGPEGSVRVGRSSLLFAVCAQGKRGRPPGVRQGKRGGSTAVTCSECTAGT